MPTASPGAQCTAATVPAAGARSSFSIFIASSTTSPSPAFTSWPASTSTCSTSPGIGAWTSRSAASAPASSPKRSSSSAVSSRSTTGMRRPSTVTTASCCPCRVAPGSTVTTREVAPVTRRKVRASRGPPSGSRRAALPASSSRRAPSGVVESRAVWSPTRAWYFTREFGLGEGRGGSYGTA